MSDLGDGSSSADQPTVAVPPVSSPPGMAPGAPGAMPTPTPPGMAAAPTIGSLPAGMAVLGNGGDSSSDLGFLQRKPGDRMRHVSLDARSVEIPAWLSIPSVVVAVVVAGFAVSLALSSGWSGLAVGTSSSVRLRDGMSRDCRRDLNQLAVAEGAFLNSVGRLPVDQAELVEQKYLPGPISGYEVKGDGSIGTVGTRCLVQRDTTTRVVLPAALIALVGLGLLAIVASLLLNTWWLHRAYESLPGGIRSFSPAWVFGPLVAAVAFPAWAALVNHVLVKPDEIDRVSLLVILGAVSVALWGAFCAMLVRLGSMVTDIGNHFAKFNLPGRLVRGMGLWLFLGIGVGALAGGGALLVENDNLPRWAPQALLASWFGIVVLFALAVLLTLPVLVLRATRGQREMLLETARWEGRIDEERRQETNQAPAPSNQVGSGVGRDPIREPVGAATPPPT